MVEKIENYGENSSPLTSLPVDRLTATDCNAAARAKSNESLSVFLFILKVLLNF